MSRKQTRGGAAVDNSLEALLLPIVALAVKSRLGSDRFVQAAKRAYVRAAVDEAFSSNSKINYSRVAVITGLTRKDVSSLVGQIGGRSQPPRASREQRALRVVRGWRMDPRFHDQRDRPAELPLRAGRRTFAMLVKSYAGDVTPMSVLSELERLNLVTRGRSKNVLRLLSPRGLSRAYIVQNATELARLLGDFISAVSQKPSGEPPVFFSFKESTLSLPDQAARFARVFSNRASALLEGFDQWIATQTRKPKRALEGTASKSRVGLGIYLVREAIRHTKPRVDVRDKRRRSQN